MPFSAVELFHNKTRSQGGELKDCKYNETVKGQDGRVKMFDKRKDRVWEA